MDRGKRRILRLSVVAVLALVASTTAGCELLFGRMTGPGPSPVATTAPRPTAAIDSPSLVMTETGVVLSVVGTSPTDVTGFTLRTNDGREVTFAIGQLDLVAGFNAGHLREHQATADPVRVLYVLEGDRRLAIQLTDAP